MDFVGKFLILLEMHRYASIQGTFINQKLIIGIDDKFILHCAIEQKQYTQSAQNRVYNILHTTCYAPHLFQTEHCAQLNGCFSETVYHFCDMKHTPLNCRLEAGKSIFEPTEPMYT